MILPVLFAFFMQTFTVRLVNGGGLHYCEYQHTNPCQYGSCSAYNSGNSYTCTCYNGYIGTNCNQIDCSSHLYCKNGGACFTTNGGTVKICECGYGWTGDNCEEIDVCTPYTNADIVFVVDISESEGSSILSRQRDYIKDFVSKFPVGPLNYRYQFSVVTVASEPIVHFYLDQYQDNDTLLAAIDSIPLNSKGPSYTGKALKVVNGDVFNVSNGARSSVERYVIVLTDGLSSNPTDTILQAAELKSNGVKIYAVGVGQSVNHQELLDIATYQKHVFSMYTPDALQNLLKYTMYGCTKCTDKMSDVAIVMDVSSYIEAEDFNMQINAASHLIKQANTGPNDVQFSLTTFTEHYTPVYNFDTFDNKPDLVAKINAETKMKVKALQICHAF